MLNIKKIAILALLCVCSTLLKAQNLSFGPTVGVNFANLSGFNSLESKAGLSTGLFLNYSTQSHFGIGAQVLYSELGAKFKNSDEEINLDYVQIPVLATYYFGSKQTTGLWRPKVFAGPYVGFLTSAQNQKGGDLNQGGAYYNKTDVGLTLGAGVNYALSQKMWLNLDARYGLGLTDVMKGQAQTVANRAFSVNFGLSFPLGTYK